MSFTGNSDNEKAGSISIFISYRRDDGGHGRALYEFLCHWFDEADVFYDHENLGPGQKFRPELTKAIRQSKVFLAVIGPHWFSDKNRQRLADADDTTHGEIRTALEQESAGQMSIIPVLCGGALVPDSSLLPAEIATLCDSNAHHLPESQYRPAQQKLLEHLKSFGLTPRYRPRHGTTQIFHTIDNNLTPFFSDPVGNLPLLYTTLHETGQAAVLASAATATLHGMGGVGKTQLALKYSHDFRDEYAGVWWFRTEDLGRLQQDCQQFCERCGVQVYTGEEHHQAVKRWLQEQPCWLLVYDNAEAQYGEQKETLHQFLPGSGHHVLITSRNNCWEGLAKPIELDVWNEEQALEFLRKRLGKATDEELRQLCRALGGLPLALEQACAYIVTVGVSVDVYCRALANWEKGERLLDRKDSLATGYSLSVLATLSLAFGRLSQGARELLRLCAWCAAEPIPESLFLKADEQGEEIRNFLPEALYRATADDLLWGETVAELTSFALVQRVMIDLMPPGENARQLVHALLFHRLTQSAVIHRLSDPADDVPILTLLLGVTFPIDMKSPSCWPFVRVIGPHLLRLEEHLVTGHVPFRQLGWLLDKLATFLQYGPALYDQAIIIFRRELDRSKKFLGADHPETLTAMHNLALSLRSVGDYKEAIELQNQVFTRRKDILGENHPDTLASMNNLAGTLNAIGDIQNTRLFQEYALESSKQVLGLDHPDTLSIMNNQSIILMKMKDYQGAMELQKYALENRKRILGLWHPDTLTSMSNLASILREMGDYKLARELGEQVLDLMQKHLGFDHPDTLSAMNNLALTLSKLDEIEDVLKLQKHVLERRKEILGLANPDTTAAAWNFICTLRQMNNYAAATAVMADYLIWLLGDEVELHSAVQRSIRDKLRQIVAPR